MTGPDTLLLTNEQYVRLEGSKCPRCHSQNITTDKHDTDGDPHACMCHDCKFHWRNVYVLTGWEFSE